MKILYRFKLWLWYKTKVKKPLHIKIIAARKNNAEQLVLLHGIASSIEVWHEVVAQLGGSYNIALVDLLGFGSSPKPEDIDYNVDQHSYALHYSLKKVGIKKGAVVAGHSMGAIIATHYGANYPQKVLRLVLCSIPIYKRAELSDKKLFWWQKQTDNLYFRLYRLLRHKKEFSLRTAQALHKMGLRQVELHSESWVAFKNSLRNTIEHQVVETDLRKLTVPVDIVYGKLDFLLISKHLDELAKLPNVVVQKVNARHDLTKSYSHDIAKLILSR